MSETEVYEKPNKKTEKPSKLWYLLSIFLGIIGGLIGYIELKNKDKKMANNVLIVGVVISLIPIAVIFFGVFAYYGIFAPSSFVGHVSSGFGSVTVIQPWQVSSAGDITLNVQNRLGQAIVLNEIQVSKGSLSGSCVLPNDFTIVTGETKLVTCNIKEIAGNSGSTYNLLITFKYLVKNASLSIAGNITGIYS